MRGAEAMTTEYQPMQEEQAYRRLLEEKGEMFSRAARTVLKEAEAEVAAYGENLVHSYAFQPEEYDEAMEKMRLAATDIIGRDRELLARLWCSALATAASIDPDDETSAGFRVVRGDVHWFNRMASGMVEEILQEKKTAELREKIAEREPENPEDLPF
jgi:hypothetical protein